MLGDGARPIGWKLGLGTPAAMERLGTAAPLIGFITDRGVLASGASCAIGGWGKRMAEPEVAITHRSRGAGSANESQAAAAMGAIGPAIELVDLADSSDVEEILAGDIFHRHLVLGPTEAGPGEALRGRSGSGTPIRSPSTTRTRLQAAPPRSSRTSRPTSRRSARRCGGRTW